MCFLGLFLVAGSNAEIIFLMLGVQRNPIKERKQQLSSFARG